MPMTPEVFVKEFELEADKPGVFKFVAMAFYPADPDRKSPGVSDRHDWTGKRSWIFHSGDKARTPHQYMGTKEFASAEAAADWLHGADGEKFREGADLVCVNVVWA